MTITAPISGTLYAVGDLISFSGTVSDAEDSAYGGIKPISMTWEAVLHHGEHVHPNFVSSVGASGSFEVIDHGDNTCSGNHTAYYQCGGGKVWLPIVTRTQARP